MLDATDASGHGSRVKSLPGLTPDGERIITSDEVLSGKTLPKSIIVVGGGAVGVEFASFYHDAGVEVTLLEYLPRLTPLEDPDISKELERSFKRRGMKIMTSARFDSCAVSVDESGVGLMVGPEGEEPKELRAEQMLVATGARAKLGQLGLESTRAKVEKGFVTVDADAHGRAASVRVWRPDRRPACLRTLPRTRHRRRARDRRGRSGVRRLPQDAARDLYPGHRSRRSLTEEECARDGIGIRTGKFPFQRRARR